MCDRNQIRPQCRYSRQEIETIIKALKEIQNHERNMQAFYKGFGTIYEQRCVEERLRGLTDGIDCLKSICIHDI